MAKTPRKDNVKFKKKKGFTQVQNWAPDDMTLSDKALGLYTRIQRWITFEAENFECSKAFIRTKTPSGEKAFDSAWNELKERGYLKMYCIPPANWEAELLDEPQPDTPHTYYLNADGEIKSTNVDRAEKKKKALETAPDKGSEYYPQKRGNTKRSNTKKGNIKRDNTNNSNTNGGKNINTTSNTVSNTSLNTSDNTLDNISYQSINPKEEEPSKRKTKDRMIDMELITEIKNQINYDGLVEDGVLQNSINEDDLNAAIDAIASLKTVTKEQEINGNLYSPDFIRFRADSIRQEHIQYVFECFYENRTKVNNIVAYMRTAIFNAPSSMGVYYHNAVRANGFI